MDERLPWRRHARLVILLLLLVGAAWFLRAALPIDQHWAGGAALAQADADVPPGSNPVFLPLIANQAGQTTRQSNAEPPEKAFALQLQTLTALLTTLDQQLAAAVDPTAVKLALQQEKSALLALDPQIRQTFAVREQSLQAAALPALILERHAATVAAYNQQWQTLLEHFAALETAPDNNQLRAAVARTQTLLQKSQLQAANRLPTNDDLVTQKAKAVTPVLTFETTLPAVTAATTQTGLSIPGTPPGATDLLPTIDVTLDQAIIDLAASLDNSPLQIYHYVKNNIAYEPYLGSRKGALATLQLQAGNDYDQASLLIALLRAAGIPARYVAGRALLPAAQVNNWLGVDSVNAAGGLLAMAGLAVQGYTLPTGQALAFDHVWVAAYLPYTNYRGVAEDDSGKQWIALDPSVKVLEIRPGLDIPAAMNFNATAFVDSYISTFHTASPVELYLQQIEQYVSANYPTLTYPADIIRQRKIQSEPLPHLPASLPYLITSQSADFAEIPAAKRFRIGIELVNGNQPTVTSFTYTADLPALVGKRITLSYLPATPADQAVVDFYGNLYATPPNLIQLKPVLKLAGVPVAEGGPVAAGEYYISNFYYYPPAGDIISGGTASQPIVTGQYEAIAFDPYHMRLGSLLPPAATPDTDGLLGEELYRTAVAYLDRQAQSWELVADTMQVAYTTSVAQAIATNLPAVYGNMSGTPVYWEAVRLTMDAQHKSVGGAFSVVNGNSELIPFMILVGADGSILENRVFEDLYDQEAISAVKVLALAADAGIPICVITTGNLGACSTLNQNFYFEVMVNQALALGYEVVVPRDRITYHDWEGGGFIARDPVTKRGYWYMVDGGLKGGATVDALDSWVNPWGIVLTNIFRQLCATDPIVANITAPTANSYWPVQKGFLPWSLPNPWNLRGLHPVFAVDYTICYQGGTSTTVSRNYVPHYPYPAGDHTFRAGWGTNATLDFTMFDVAIETPDGTYVPQSGDNFALNANVIPRMPPGGTIAWSTTNGGAFSQPNGALTSFAGGSTGATTVAVQVTNANGHVGDEQDLTVFGVAIDPASTMYVNKGYDLPVAAPPLTATVHYAISPQPSFFGLLGFLPQAVRVVVKDNVTSILTTTLAIDQQQWQWDGRNSAGQYVPPGIYTIHVEAIAPNGKKAIGTHPLYVVEVQEVQLLDQAGNSLDDNAHPTHPGGKRVFPDSPTAGAPRNNVVKVRAILNTNVPVNVLPIYLRSYDVHDPTGLIDANTSDSVENIPTIGELSDLQPSTDDDNTVEVNFKVTMQPGDNFKVLASANSLLLQGIHTTTITTTMDITGITVDPVLQPLTSERLTVWRRVHIEADAMGPVVGNQVTGTIIRTINNGATSTVTTDQHFIEPYSAVTSTHRFAGGSLIDSNGARFSVITNTHGSTLTLMVNNIGGVGGSVPITGAFTLVDDDDLNNDDGANLDGDINELFNANSPDMSFMQESDIITNNVFAEAYVIPTYDLTSTRNVTFAANTLPGNAFTQTLAFDQDATEEDPDFWTGYVLAAYQASTLEDNDPSGEVPVLGYTDGKQYGIAVFLATGSEFSIPTCEDPYVVAHEFGHLFGVPHHGGGDLMEAACNNIGIVPRFDATSLEIIRRQVAP